MNTLSKLSLILTSAVIITLTGCKTLQENADSQAVMTPDGVTLMNETELRETLVGNTYAGDSVKNPGNSYIEYIHPDGSIHGLWNGSDHYQGKWVISGQVWCFKYSKINGCNTLSRSGNTIYWYQVDGSTLGGKATVTSGDSNNLSP